MVNKISKYQNIKFDKNYTEYWEDTVQNSVDGTVIAGLKEVDYFLFSLGLKKTDIILDLGCSYGRMYSALSSYSENIFGVEPDNYAVEKASKLKYKKVYQGTAEKTGCAANFFDFVFCWAVFDIVDQSKGLKEINRILKDKGLLVITGKADFYNPFDFLALKAEKNAYLKGFPNRFTNLSMLISQIDFFGLKIIDIFTFPNRGDFGLLNYKRENLLKLKVGEEISGYEYLMIAQKISNVEDNLIKKRTSFDQDHSKTAQTIARNAGFASFKEYFEYIGID
jgi:SAM-dependent methyltransferase